MRIQHNLAGINSYRQLNITMLNQSKSAEKLSSAYKINRAADDAAGLSISEKMRAQIRGLNRGAENIEDGISFTQVADGALHEAHAILQRINELAVQSANGTNSESDRVALDNEVQQLKTELERIFTTTTFNDEQIWPDDYIKNTPQVVGSIQVQAVKMTTPSSQKNDISNANFDQIAKGSYTIVATDTGVGLSWNDYNGDPHTTNEITWDQLRADDFKFRASSLFNEDDLFDANGDPLFDFEVSMKVKPQASNAAIKKAIDGTRMSSYAYASLSAETQDSFGAQTAIQGVSWGASIEYSAAYESRKNVGTAGYDFDNVQDAFFEPVPVTGTGGNKISGPYTTDVDVAKESTQGWKYRFNLQGVGTVTATSSSIYYYSSDKSSDAEGTWCIMNIRPMGKNM